jgi:hypothetical protein
LDTDPIFGVFFMAKYTEQFKLSVIQDFKTRAMGSRDIAAQGSRKAFERTLTDKHVDFDTIAGIVSALGYKLTVQRTTQPKATDIWQIAGVRYTTKASTQRVEFALGVRYHIPIIRFPQFAALDREPTLRDLKAVKVQGARWVL